MQAGQALTPAGCGTISQGSTSQSGAHKCPRRQACPSTHLCIKRGVGLRAVRGLGQVPPEGAAHAAGGGLVQDGRVRIPPRQVGSEDVVAATVLEHRGTLCAVACLQAGTGGMPRLDWAFTSALPDTLLRLNKKTKTKKTCTLLQMVPVVASQSGRRRDTARVITGQLQGGGAGRRGARHAALCALAAAEPCFSFPAHEEPCFSFPAHEIPVCLFPLSNSGTCARVCLPPNQERFVPLLVNSHVVARIVVRKEVVPPVVGPCGGHGGGMPQQQT